MPNSPHHHSNIYAETWRLKPLQQWNSDVCIWPLTLSETIIELLIQARMTFIETLLCVSYCRYIITNPYPDLRGHTLDYYLYFTEEDIESGAFA